MMTEVEKRVLIDLPRLGGRVPDVELAGFIARRSGSSRQEVRSAMNKMVRYGLLDRQGHRKGERKVRMVSLTQWGLTVRARLILEATQ